MSWVTIIWSVVASACLTLAAMNLLVWCKKRTAWANLLFSLTAAATAALAACEFWMMRAETPTDVGEAIRWGHVPFWVLMISLVGFVRLHMRAGRPWLAWAVCVVRTLSLILNFLFTPNLNFREITALGHIRFLGESVSIGEGVRNPWMLIGQASLLLLVVFIVDVALTIWRRGDERRARLLVSTMVFFTVASTGQIVLALWGIIPMPFTMSLFFMPIVVAMGLELSNEVLRAAQLSEDLRESEARMTLAAEAAGFGIWMWSITSNQIWGSVKWLGLFGFAPDEAVTFEKVIQRIHPDDREVVELAVRRALEDRVDYAGEYRVVLPDNTRRWVAARGRVYTNTQGKPVRMMGATIDITHRKRTDLALAESELRYRTLFETAPEGILLIGADGYVRAANPAQARLYGYESPQQIEGMYTPLFVAEKDRERAAQNMKDLLNGEERPARCYSAVRRDGSEFIVEVTSAILRGPGREVQGYLCLTRDITESKRTEVAMKESVQRFRQVIEFSGEFIWEVDAKGLYTYASPSVERVLGYTAEDLVGKKHFYDLFDPSVREELKAAAFQVFADRQTFRGFPNPNVSKSGKIVHLETSGVPMLNPAGNLTGYRGADTDVTGRRQAEQEISEQRNQVAHLSRVNMLGELAGSLAHELNQPLTAVLSNAQAAQRFLAHDPVDLNEVRDILADIVAEDKRAGEVIRRLRLLLKKGEVQHQPLNVNEIVQEVLKIVRSDLVNQNFTARTELAPDLPVLHGDRVQLQQVLLNLVMNGCDAMAGAARNNRRLTIRTSRGEDGSAHLSVADCGAGIAPEKLEQVFEPFYTTKPHGMGLGLAVCRTIVTAHGGKLWATNNPGLGATFHFTLPVNGKGQGAGGK